MHLNNYLNARKRLHGTEKWKHLVSISFTALWHHSSGLMKSLYRTKIENVAREWEEYDFYIHQEGII